MFTILLLLLTEHTGLFLSLAGAGCGLILDLAAALYLHARRDRAACSAQGEDRPSPSFLRSLKLAFFTLLGVAAEEASHAARRREQIRRELRDFNAATRLSHDYEAIIRRTRDLWDR